MGYTHYWVRPPTLPAPSFGQAVADYRRLLPQLNIPLAGGDGTGRPVFRCDAVVLNGVGPASYETFDLRLEETDPGNGRLVFSFCKTDHKPYDLAVQAALIVFQHHLGAKFRVSSDGAEAHWDGARRLCQEHLGYGSYFKRDQT